MTVTAEVKEFIRPVRDIIYTFFGFVYDFARFFRYGGWKDKSRNLVRDYKSVKIYHRLEKSLSFRQRDSGSGWGAANDLYRHLKKYVDRGVSLTHHEKVGLKVLGDFLAESGNESFPDFSRLVDFHKKCKMLSSERGGILEKERRSITEGKLQDPRTFFLSRYSVRDFSDEAVADSEIEKAISLALNTPSVCNRQASFIYSLHTRQEIDKALSLQNGNRGFGHEVPCLLILCADLSAFDTAGERYQHWIDGGMFSMSIIWALHSLGLSSCCLNWSKGPVDDLKLRKLIDIKSEHTVLMMLAVGFPRENIKVCYSERKPVDNFYKCLD